MQIRCVAPWAVIGAGMVRMGTRVLWRNVWLVGDVAFLLDDTGRVMSEAGWLSMCPRWVRRGVQPLWATAWILRDDLEAGSGACLPSEETSKPRVGGREVRAGVEPPSTEGWTSVVWPLASREDVVELDGRIARLERRLNAFEKRQAV